MKLKQLFHRIFGPRAEPGRFVGRARTKDDTAIKYRMSAGFAGDVNRTHPASISAHECDTTNPPQFFGQAVVFDSSSHKLRAMLATDNAADHIAGILVRPYPTQATSLTTQKTLGGLSIPDSTAIQDKLDSGYIMVPVAGTAAKGGRVYVWTAANSGSHYLGAFETTACSQKTILLDENSYFMGPADANGIAEVAFNL